MVIKPKYLIITPFFPTEESFRAPFVLDQVNAIKKNGKYDLIVFKPKYVYGNETDYEYEGIKVCYFDVYDLPAAILPGLFAGLNIRSFFNKLHAEEIQIPDISVVHSHVTPQALYANALKKRNPGVISVLQHHGFDVLSLENGRFSKFKWHRAWVRKFGGSLCNLIDLHIGVSKKTLDQFNGYPEIILKNKYVLYNGVDPGKFYPIPGIRDPKSFSIGCVGNFWVLKDQITLIKAVETLIKNGLTDLKVFFVGTGQTLESCKEYVENNKLQPYISFQTELFHRDLIKFYNSLDLFVLPSFWEAFGCVYVEAHTCDVPFIGVEGQGIEELILPENREYQLISRSDVAGLCERITHFYSKRDYKTALKEDVDINILIKGFLDFLDSDEVHR